MTDAMERRVESALSAWGQAGVPADDAAGSIARQKSTVRVIERALADVAQRRRHQAAMRRWGVPFASAAACLGLLLGGVLWYRGMSQSDGRTVSELSTVASTYAEARAISGGVVARRNGVPELLPVGAAIRIGAGDVLSTPPDGGARVGLDEGGNIELASATELAMPVRIPGVERFNLNLGRVSVDVPPNPSRTRMLVVQTPDVAVTVHGTSFVVDVHELSDTPRSVTSVSVNRGRVWIMRDGLRVAVLGAGEKWSSVASSRGSQSSEVEAALGSEGVEQHELGQGGAPAKRRATTNSTGRNASIGKSVGTASESVGTVSVGTVSTVADGPVVSDRLRRENRQFQAALQARNAGDDRTTVARLDRFLRTFPDSVLAQEARVERFRALKRLGRDQDAERAARQYLADYDDGFARGEARNIALSPDATGGSSGR